MTQKFYRKEKRLVLNKLNTVTLIHEFKQLGIRRAGVHLARVLVTPVLFPLADFSSIFPLKMSFLILLDAIIPKAPDLILMGATPRFPGFITNSTVHFSSQALKRWHQCSGRNVRLMITMTHQ